MPNYYVKVADKKAIEELYEVFVKCGKKELAMALARMIVLNKGEK